MDKPRRARLTAGQTREAFWVAQEIPDEGLRSEAFSALARHLAPANILGAMRLIQSRVSDQGWRLWSLAAPSARLPAEYAPVIERGMADLGESSTRRREPRRQAEALIPSGARSPSQRRSWRSGFEPRTKARIRKLVSR